VDVAGIWHGEYRYSPEEAASPVAFTMRLVQDAQGLVTGTVTEGPGGMPEEGRIIGTCRRRSVQFLKLMPVARVGATEGTQELAAFLATDGYEVEGPIEHPQLLYEGRLAADGAATAGTWRLDEHVVPLKDGRTAYIPGCRGTWSARRVDP
jgi:hypothetical protein